MNVWRDRLSRWFEPAAARCPLTPNQLTLVAFAFNIATAACFFLGDRHPRLFLVAVGLLTVGGLLDAFDGIVARAQNLSSSFGDFLDHFIDRISDVLLAACWMIGNGVGELLVVGAVIMVSLNGYIGTQIEATWHQRKYDTVGRGEFVLAMIVYPIASFLLHQLGMRDLEAYGFTIAEWLTIALIVLGFLGIGQRMTLAYRLGER